MGDYCAFYPVSVNHVRLIAIESLHYGGQYFHLVLIMSPITALAAQLSHPFRPVVATCFALGGLLMATPASAISYGVYDSRALAMGGAATAIGTHAQAAFYTPALLAFHNREEEEGRDGRVYLPSLIVQVSDGAQDAVDAVEDELDIQLSNAVNQFNNAPLQTGWYAMSQPTCATCSMTFQMMIYQSIVLLVSTSASQVMAKAAAFMLARA